MECLYDIFGNNMQFGILLQGILESNCQLLVIPTDSVKQWDAYASYCLVTEAGGKMTDMFGNDIEYNTEKLNHENGLLISNGLIHN